MLLVLKIELIRLWNSILPEPQQPSAQLSKLIRLTACKKTKHTVSRWCRTVYIPRLVPSYDTHKGKRWLNSKPPKPQGENLVVERLQIWYISNNTDNEVILLIWDIIIWSCYFYWAGCSSSIAELTGENLSTFEKTFYLVLLNPLLVLRAVTRPMRPVASALQTGMTAAATSRLAVLGISTTASIPPTTAMLTTTQTTSLQTKTRMSFTTSQKTRPGLPMTRHKQPGNSMAITFTFCIFVFIHQSFEQ